MNNSEQETTNARPWKVRYATYEPKSTGIDWLKRSTRRKKVDRGAISLPFSVAMNIIAEFEKQKISR